MAVERLDSIVRVLMNHGRDPDTPACAVQDGTLPSQRIVTGSLATVASQAAEAGIRPPSIVVIGDVVNVAREIEVLRSKRRTTHP